MNYRRSCLLLTFVLAGAALAAAAPLKVLVIGGPGGGCTTFPDAALAELFSRAYGWDTRATQFYTKLDVNPLYRGELGTVEDVQREKFSEVLRLLRDWRPDVTVARLPRKDFNAITPEIQQELITRVQNGMGLVAWASEHGGVDYRGEPLQEILAAEGFGADYSGGASDASWRWAAHRLNFGIPLDQAAHQGFFALMGNASEFHATDLVLTGDENSGRIRVREAGRGRVVMLGHTSSYALGGGSYPQLQEPFTMDVLEDRPDWGEIHLRLLHSAVLWAKGDQPDQRIAINIPPLKDSISPGTAPVIPFQVLNETGHEVQAAVWATLDGGRPVMIGKLSTPVGLSEQKIAVPFSGNLRGGWVPLEVSLRDGHAILGSPPAVALRYARVSLPMEVTLTADRRGVARGNPITFTAKLKNVSAAKDSPVKLVWTVNDHQQRVIAAHSEPLSVSPGGEVTGTFRWTLPDFDPTHYRYVARATVMSKTATLGDATLPVFRAERYSLGEGIYHGVWGDLGMFPEALVPSLLDLYAEAGCRGMHTQCNQLQIFYQEQRNWRGYFEAMGNQDFADWATISDDEALAKGRDDVAKLLRRIPLQHSGAFPLLSLSEEACLTADGHAVCDLRSEKDMKPATFARIRQGYLDYLQRTYGTLDKLNAQWDQRHTAWDQIEMPWKYFNFYYSDRAMPDKGVTNFGPAVDQMAYQRAVWQKAYDAHTRALQEVLPTARTLVSTGDFMGTKTDAPNPTDTGHTFVLDWACFDDTERTQQQFGNYLVNGATMAAYWFDMPLTFNPDLTHTRASVYRRREFDRALERAPLILHAQAVPPTPEVVLYRPQSPYGREFYTLLGNALPRPWIPFEPPDTWRQLLRISGVFPSSEPSPASRLLILPIAVTLSADQAHALAAFVRAGGTLVTMAGLAEYDLHGKPYPEYPGAGLSELLGLTLKPEYTRLQALKWTLSAWPRGQTPETGTLFSTGRDTIAQQAADVQVLGTYADGAPALLYRKVGQGQVFHFNGVYFINYNFTFDQVPFWPNMGALTRAVLDLAGVGGAVNVVGDDGKPLESLSWNLAGAGTANPGPGDVRYVRILGSLTPAPVRVVTKQPVAFARDALTGRALNIEQTGDSWIIPVSRGPESAHYVALFPYQPAKLIVTPKQSNIPSGTTLELQVQILDSAGKNVTGKHAVTARATLHGQLVTQWREIQGEGVIGFPLAARDAGRVTIEVMDWTSGLSAKTMVSVKPASPIAELPAPLPSYKRGMPPRALNDAEVVTTLDRLAKMYALGPDAFQCAAETKWRLGYYTFLMDEGRHNLVARLLAPSPWNPKALRQALASGARWILTGEDVGIDGLQGQSLSPYDHLGQLTEALSGARSVSVVAGAPDQVIYTFSGGGRVLLDRRSFDYWSGDAVASQQTDWNGVAVVTRTAVSSFSGSVQQFSDAYKKWWTELKAKGLLDTSSHATALVPAPRSFDLRSWWKHGFSEKERQEIAATEVKLNLPLDRWEPPSVLDGYRLGKVILDENFSQKNERWTFESGRWRWEPGKLVQHVTSRELAEGAGWGGNAVAKDVADPSKGPILIEACGRITFGYSYGWFGVGGGYIPGDPASGLACQIGQVSLGAGTATKLWLDTKNVKDILRSPEDDIQFVVLLDGKNLRAKVWNWGSQPEPKEWQFSGTENAAHLGNALLLRTNLAGYWRHVRVWQLEKTPR